MIGLSGKNGKTRTSAESSTESGSPTGRLTDNVQSVAGDIADLFELQADLFGRDLRATGRMMAVPVVLGLVGAIVLATASLLAFAGLALWLHTAHDFGLAVSFLLASAGAVVFGLLCLLLAYGFVRWWGIPLSRSWRELKLNLAWTRRALFGAPRSR